MTKLSANSQEYIQIFKQLQPTIEANSTNLLNDSRSEAIAKFEQLGGFPTTKVEDYKYTDLDKVFGYDYGIDAKNSISKITFENNYKLVLEEAYTITLRNGYYEHCENADELKKQGIIVCSLKEAAEQHSAIFQKYYNQKAKESDHSIAALNTAFITDGLFIFLPKKAVVEKPFQIVNILHSNDDIFLNSRHLFVVEAQAEAKFLDAIHILNCKEILNNSVVELYAEQNAKAEYYTVQNQSNTASLLTNVFVSQKRDSEVRTNTLSLNAKQIRNNVTVDLEDENCENHTYGIYLPKGEEKVDNFTAINHIAAHCNSWEHFKGVLDDKSETAFCGRIHVCEDAQKTEAYQTNNNLVLTNEAKANTKPQLIIEADDVSCSHGATVGQIDDEAIFYLRARGISYDKAYKMMMLAFMNEVTNKISIPELREQVEQWISDKMNAETTHCDCCNKGCEKC